MGKIGQRHPETRSEVVGALVTLLAGRESQMPEERILNGVAVSVLLDLKAIEAVPAIRQAYYEDRVDTSIVDLDLALAELGLPPEQPVVARLLARSGGPAMSDSHGPELPALRATAQVGRKIGRNAPCPCGSGKKYKKCHGR